jgi:hypothetical protein
MIEYRATTYESSTHTYVIQILTSTDSQFQQEIVQTEQMYGRFVIRSTKEVFERLRDLVNENSIYTITLEYGI